MNLYFKYFFLFPLLAHFPQKIAFRLASLYGRLSLKKHLEDRVAIIEQMQAVFTEKDREELGSMADYFFCMIEREALDSWFFRTCNTQTQVDQFVQLENFNYVTAARTQGRRVIISSGHFGRFWMAGVAMKAQGISVGTITRDGGESNAHDLPTAEFQYRKKKLAWLQQCFGGPFLVEGDLIRPIYRALDQHVMALFIDVPYEGDKNGCIQLPFLGRTARFPLGVARIAQKTNALIIPFYVFESQSGLRANFSPPVDAAELNEQEIMSYLVNLLEQQILTSPEQWWLWQALPLMWQ